MLNSLICYILSGILVYFGLKKFKKHINEKKWARWANYKKDVVIFHGYPRGKVLPNSSPFAMKVENYLRMAKIPYEFDCEDQDGPTGKIPWITFNSQNIGDSTFIIEFLNKKFDVNLNKGYGKEELAISRSLRIMLEEHALWGLAAERFIYGFENLQKVQQVPIAFLSGLVGARRIRNQMWYHGIGRHSQEQLVQLVSNDLRTLSDFLANKKFILGDTVCEDDSAIFGFISVFCWGIPNSPYTKLIYDELPNLKEYAERMRKNLYPDWNDCLDDTKWTWSMVFKALIHELI